jgi:hypothetical protein
MIMIPLLIYVVVDIFLIQESSKRWRSGCCWSLLRGDEKTSSWLRVYGTSFPKQKI